MELFGKNARFECTNCEFDTLTIIVADVSDWTYCPKCGSHLKDIMMSSDVPHNRSTDADISEKKADDNGKTTIDITTPEDDTTDADKSERVENSDGQNEQGSNDTTIDDTQGGNVEDIIDEEIKRLRDEN